MLYLIKLLRAARTYRKAYIKTWETNPNGEDKEMWNDLEDKEHDLLEIALKKGK